MTVLYISIAVMVLAFILFLIIIIKSKKKAAAGASHYSSSRTGQEGLGKVLRKLFSGKVIDEKILEELEDTLIKADIGPKISNELINGLRGKKPQNIEEAISILKSELSRMIIDSPLIIEKGKLNILLILGVNGVGKTTTLAKVASYYLNKGFKVLLAAGDTFRAAAIEQLTKWANLLNVPVIKQQENSDPASVVFDAIESAKARQVDLLLVDTAGRLHTKANLMDELKKIESVISKKNENVVKKNILVIDATTGQNALQQALSFHSAVHVDGIIITKYDSESKGGIIINIQKNLNLPFYFIGNGEKLDKLKEFNKHEFIENIFS